jgi:hypothetical protein
MSVTSLFALAETSVMHGVNHWVVGGGTFVVLLLAMGALLVFGGGRDHS